MAIMAIFLYGIALKNFLRAGFFYSEKSLTQKSAKCVINSEILREKFNFQGALMSF